MKKYEADNGNCFQCCVAGLLDLPLEEVPDIMDFRKVDLAWHVPFATWCREKHGMGLLIAEGDSLAYNVAFIEVFENLDKLPHAVLANALGTIHDPGDPAKTPTDRDVMYRIFLIPIGDQWTNQSTES